MGLPLIVLGDKTSHGGTVIEGSMTTTIDGKPVARVGDKVSCPIPGHGTCVIVSGDMTWIIDGQAVARHGDMTACGASLISSQIRVIDYGSGGYPSSANTKSTQAAVAASAAAGAGASETTEETLSFDHRFQLFDELTGVPLAKQRYKLYGPNELIEGVTDDEGFTQVISTGDKAKNVHIEIIGEGWPKETL